MSHFPQMETDLINMSMGNRNTPIQTAQIMAHFWLVNADIFFFFFNLCMSMCFWFSSHKPSERSALHDMKEFGYSHNQNGSEPHQREVPDQWRCLPVISPIGLNLVVYCWPMKQIWIGWTSYVHLNVLIERQLVSLSNWQEARLLSQTGLGLVPGYTQRTGPT